MKRVEVLFLKDGATYGYLYPAGHTGMVYSDDIEYLVANGVIKAPEPEIIETAQVWPHLQKRSLLDKIKGLFR
jgi:hypothetical protein